MDGQNKAISHGKCLHIGCGLNAPSSWENFDASPSLRLTKLPLSKLIFRGKVPDWPKNAVYGDIAKGLECIPVLQPSP